MTPDQERLESKVDELITMVRNLGTSQLAQNERINRVERHLHATIEWVKWLRDRARGDKGDSMRPPMQTLSEVSSIEVGGFGAHVRATGKAPVRLAIGLLLLALGLGGVYYTMAPHGGSAQAQEKP